MIVNVPTKVIPVWFIEKWKTENAEPGSALDVYIDRMMQDWKTEEASQKGG